MRPALVGRDQEVGRLTAALDRLPQQGAALVVRGSPGVGKTALLDHVRGQVLDRGWGLLSAVGSTAETTLPFGVLHQLLQPVLGTVDELPALLREALDRCFGLRQDDQLDHGLHVFRVGLAVLELLRAPSAPQALIVDDGHTVDPDTATVLAFVARRVASLPVVVVISGRPELAPIAGVEELEVEPLGEDAAQELLDRRWPALPASARRAVLQGAAGNPLGLVELPAALGSEQDQVLDDPHTWLPLNTRLERVFGQQSRGLPAPTVTALVALALDGRGDLGRTMAAATAASGGKVTTNDLDAAIGVGLVHARAGTVEFCHPLMASGVLDRASTALVHALHAALAEAHSDEPERRAWHRAASGAPDDTVAAELDAAARRSARRGACVAAVRAWRRAAELTADRPGRDRRLVRAAELTVELGDRLTTERLLADLDDPHQPAATSIRLLMTQEWFVADGAGAERVGALLELAEGLAADGRTDLALQTVYPLALSGHPAVTRRVVALISRIAPEETDPTVLLVAGQFAIAEQGAWALGQSRRMLAQPGLDPEQRRAYATAAINVGDFETAIATLPDATAELREQGRLSLAARGLVSLSWAYLHCGELPSAEATAIEAEALCHEAWQPFWVGGALSARLWVVAQRAAPDVLRCILRDEVSTLPPDATPPFILAMIERVRGASALAHGSSSEAFDHLAAAFTLEWSMRWWGFADLAEAAARSGRHQEVRGDADQLGVLAATTGSPLLTRYHQFVAPLLVVDPHQAEPLYLAGLAGLDGDRFLHARLGLAYGTWLRRQRRIAESRDVLTAAEATLDTLGAAQWAHQARRELRATGERRRPPDQPPSQLTAQEAEVARLVADGLSNRAVAETLRISHRTVSTHLQRIFRKLGIDQRRHIADHVDRAPSSTT